MHLVRSIAAVAILTTGGLALGSTAASAWVCVAKNANAVEWVGRSPVLSTAKDKALTKCQIGSRPIYKATCYIKSCA
ncbi:MAG TPA: hypothetical protein VFB16_11965 [Bauldia sp.]|nr:hypothetical protein [Bauldia sp.]